MSVCVSPCRGSHPCARISYLVQPLGLYRGMAAPLAGVVPVFALNFWSYDVACHYIRHFQGVAPGGDLSLASYGLAGSMAAFPTTVRIHAVSRVPHMQLSLTCALCWGCCAQTIMGPGERIKCLLQMSTSGAPGTEKYGGGVWKVAKTLYKEGGLRSIFKGTTATFSRDFVGYIRTHWCGGLEASDVLCRCGAETSFTFRCSKVSVECLRRRWGTTHLPSLQAAGWQVVWGSGCACIDCFSDCCAAMHQAWRTTWCHFPWTPSSPASRRTRRGRSQAWLTVHGMSKSARLRERIPVRVTH